MVAVTLATFVVCMARSPETAYVNPSTVAQEFSGLYIAPEYELEFDTLKLYGAVTFMVDEKFPKKPLSLGYWQASWMLVAVIFGSFNSESIPSGINKGFLRFSPIPYGSKMKYRRKQKYKLWVFYRAVQKMNFISFFKQCPVTFKVF